MRVVSVLAMAACLYVILCIFSLFIWCNNQIFYRSTTRLLRV